jgi:hypothetical protein
MMAPGRGSGEEDSLDRPRNFRWSTGGRYDLATRRRERNQSNVCGLKLRGNLGAGRGPSRDLRGSERSSNRNPLMSLVASSGSKGSLPMCSLNLVTSARWIGEDGSRYSFATTIPHQGLPSVICLEISFRRGRVRRIEGLGRTSRAAAAVRVTC